ncbi:CCA tRNA nucleotidyltransferase [Jeotgalibacillus alimentarius]|uniref:CCA-adding enzyme n=1 Tax=Jeotgalibacillus alimentarius TaxID=135826 RepID=A0A0C2RFF1_9BACL|nr:CCA tRNA nucleotidyltransferase [Jeotgalibacillus alimentarius]KIL48910.1 CCA tRNA nucleotidyltransferase [Jeotgalibacillus alimentarius]
MNDQFNKALPVLKEIEKHGYKAFFVGGCVRDYLLERKISDIDIAVSAMPEEIKMIFEKTVDIGIDHGTVLVLHEAGQFEVTTFRTESGYSDSRRPDHVDFVRSVDEDLKRRDFTINAMALSSSFQLIDLFGGREDLKSRQIKTVGSPDERFDEDALRMMRAVRFVSQLDFFIEENTFEAMRQHAGKLKNVAVERKAAEIDKLLNGISMVKGLEYALDSGLTSFMPPLISADGISQLNELEWQILYGAERLTLMLILGRFHHPKEVLSAWRMSNKVIQKQQLLVKLVNQKDQRPFNKSDLYEYGYDVIESADRIWSVLNKKEVRASEIKVLYDSMSIKTKSDLVFKGTHLIHWTGQKGGPWVKECTALIEQLILDGQLQNNMSDIKSWVETKWHQK